MNEIKLNNKKYTIQKKAKLVVMRMVYKVSAFVCGRNDDDLTIRWLFLDFQYDWYYILFQTIIMSLFLWDDRLLKKFSIKEISCSSLTIKNVE